MSRTDTGNWGKKGPLLPMTFFSFQRYTPAVTEEMERNNKPFTTFFTAQRVQGKEVKKIRGDQLLYFSLVQLQRLHNKRHMCSFVCITRYIYVDIDIFKLKGHRKDEMKD